MINFLEVLSHKSTRRVDNERFRILCDSFDRSSGRLGDGLDSHGAVPQSRPGCDHKDFQIAFSAPVAPMI